jgi:hypothetical protein
MMLSCAALGGISGPSRAESSRSSIAPCKASFDGFADCLVVVACSARNELVTVKCSPGVVLAPSIGAVCEVKLNK